ncbi:hypothetical protein GCM10011364_14340 [Mangrovimonas yunxiaonensis]|nr:hypothetical protein GCM10011364_14340 [Mangrovimonas yunxiaonensis]
MKDNTKITKIVNNIRDYTFEIIDKKSNKNLYTTISRIYRIEKISIQQLRRIKLRILI